MARAAAPPPAVLCLWGGKAFDSFLADRALESYLSRWLGEERGEALQILYGDETSWSAVLDAVRTRSLFSSRRVVVVRYAERLRGAGRGPQSEETEDGGSDTAARLARDLGAYLDDPTPGVGLVLISAKPDRRKRHFKLLLERADVQLVEPVKGRSLQAFVREEIESRGLTLPAGVLEELLERSGQDLRRLVGEIEKLDMLAGAKRSLSAEQAEDALGRGLARPLWELADAFGRRDLRRTLALAEGLIEEREPPLLLIETLYRSLRQLRAAASLRSSGLPKPELAARLGLPPQLAFKAPDIVGQATSWPAGALDRALHAVQRADRGIKRGLDGRVAVTMVLAEALGGERRGAVRPSPRPTPR
jgi:DNA polymerase-3 subunit delta